MKSSKLIALGIALVRTSLTLAQDQNIIRDRTPGSPADEEVVARDVATTLSAQRERLEATADRLAEVNRTQAGAQRRMLLAQAGATGMGGGGFGSEFGYAGPRSAARALVIPKDANDTKSLGEVEEDLGVMSHILDKAVSSGDKAARAMGITLFSRVSGTAGLPQSLYVAGYGAIFLLNVNFPLVPPPAKEGNAEAKEPVNNEWEEARRELARPGGAPTSGDPFMVFEERYGADAVWNGRSAPAEYDAEKVDALKRDLISALKNAANIRRLNAEESVTVVVGGAEAGAMTRTLTTTGYKSGGAKNERVARVSTGEQRRGDAARLVIRVRKGDAEAFQNGKLDLDAFQKKVAVMIY